jgi:hypothetical protein
MTGLDAGRGLEAKIKAVNIKNFNANAWAYARHAR